MYRLALFLVLLVLLGAGMAAFGGEGGPTRAALRARMALMQVRTAASGDRKILVSGPDAGENVMLLDAVQVIRLQLESLLGRPVPLSGQTIRLRVLPTVTGADERGALLRMETSGGERIHRIVLPDYAYGYREEARGVVVYALLAAYCVEVGGLNRLPVLPFWSWQGVDAVLNPQDRHLVLASASEAWQEGRLPTVPTFLQEATDSRLEHPELAYGGALVYWLLTRPTHLGIPDVLLRGWAREESLDLDLLAERLGGDVDEQFDRWLLAQRRTVRGVGDVTLSHTRQLAAAWLLFAGQDGIPRDVPVEPGALLAAWIPYREAPWFEGALLARRRALQRLAPGRPERFRQIVGQFVKVLDAVASGAGIVETRLLEEEAYSALADLEADLEAAGGMLRELH